MAALGSSDAQSKERQRGSRLMTFQGRIQNGASVFDVPIPLVDGTPVEVTAGIISPVESKHVSPSLADSLLELSGIVAEGLPPDLARNHDHYLHGQPKR